jgi:hypothetical protein
VDGVARQHGAGVARQKIPGDAPHQHRDLVAETKQRRNDSENGADGDREHDDISGAHAASQAPGEEVAGRHRRLIARWRR